MVNSGVDFFSVHTSSEMMPSPGDRIKTEDNAKFVDLIPCRASYFGQDDLKKEMHSSYFSYRPGAVRTILHIVLVQIS